MSMPDLHRYPQNASDTLVFQALKVFNSDNITVLLISKTGV